MDFNGLLRNLKNTFTGGKPSVIENVLTGNKWNQDLPSLGGVAPQNQMIQNPSVASPLQAPDEVTPGLEHQAYLEREIANREPAVLSAETVAVPTPTPTPAPVQVETPETVPQAPPSTFEQLVIDVMNRNKIPAPVGLGIAQAEGGRIGENNPFNIQAYDSNPENAVDYKTPEEGVQGFADLINKDPRYAEADKYRDNPAKMVEAIQNGGYAGDPGTWKQRSINTGGAGRDFNSWADFIRATAPYRRFAN